MPEDNFRQLRGFLAGAVVRHAEVGYLSRKSSHGHLYHHLQSIGGIMAEIGFFPKRECYYLLIRSRSAYSCASLLKACQQGLSLLGKSVLGRWEARL
jgi:hypothetical protein